MTIFFLNSSSKHISSSACRISSGKEFLKFQLLQLLFEIKRAELLINRQRAKMDIKTHTKSNEISVKLLQILFTRYIFGNVCYEPKRWYFFRVTKEINYNPMLINFHR